MAMACKKKKTKKHYNKYTTMKAPKIIAEIGCNHKGDMAIAKEMIMTAATYCKADVVKFVSIRTNAPFTP